VRAVDFQRKQCAKMLQCVTWDQAVDEVNVFMDLNRLAIEIGVDSSILKKKNAFEVEIKAKFLRVSLKGGKTLLEGVLDNAVNIDESLWMIEDGIFHLVLTKAQYGTVWTSVTPQTVSISTAEQENAKKALNLERFQRENPGFDFSQASFTGNVPDPASFMGGPRR